MFNIFKRNNKDVKLFYHTDVHCHILPGVDHGAKNIQDGIELLKADMDMGIKRVILTPHVTSETFENTPETLNAAFAIFKEAVKEAGLDVELHLSAEYRIDDYWQKEYAAGHVIPMPGNYVLLENSFAQELIGSEQMMFELRCKGYYPILAHPERYSYYGHNRERYEKMHRTNVKFQLNILSLTGYYGHSVQDTARRARPFPPHGHAPSARQGCPLRKARPSQKTDWSCHSSAHRSRRCRSRYGNAPPGPARGRGR